MRNTPWTAAAQEAQADVTRLVRELIWRDGVCDQRDTALLDALTLLSYRLGRADHARRARQHMENMGEASPSLTRAMRELERDFGGAQAESRS